MLPIAYVDSVTPPVYTISLTTPLGDTLMLSITFSLVMGVTMFTFSVTVGGTPQILGPPITWPGTGFGLGTVPIGIPPIEPYYLAPGYVCAPDGLEFGAVGWSARPKPPLSSPF
jgi:hypothetical protein